MKIERTGKPGRAALGNDQARNIAVIGKPNIANR